MPWRWLFPVLPLLFFAAGELEVYDAEQQIRELAAKGRQGLMPKRFARQELARHVSLPAQTFSLLGWSRDSKVILYGLGVGAIWFTIGLWVEAVRGPRAFFWFTSAAACLTGLLTVAQHGREILRSPRDEAVPYLLFFLLTGAAWLGCGVRWARGLWFAPLRPVRWRWLLPVLPCALYALGVWQWHEGQVFVRAQEHMSIDLEYPPEFLSWGLAAVRPALFGGIFGIEGWELSGHVAVGLVAAVLWFCLGAWLEAASHRIWIRLMLFVFGAFAILIAGASCLIGLIDLATRGQIWLLHISAKILTLVAVDLAWVALGIQLFRSLRGKRA